MKLKVISTGSQDGNCYALISDSGEILLLDCGCSYNNILKGIKYRTSDVCGILLTHMHNDHVKSFRDFLRTGTGIYTNDETSAYFEIITGEKMRGMPEKIPFQCGPFTVMPFYLPHTNTDLTPCSNFGYLVFHRDMGTLLYATDMQAIAKSNGCGYLINKFNVPIIWNMDNHQFAFDEENEIQLGTPIFLNFKKHRINHMLIEANYSFADRANIDPTKRRHVIRGHHSLEACKGFVKGNQTSNLMNIILCHLSGENADEEQILREVKEIAWSRVNVNIAKPGLCVEINRFPF